MTARFLALILLTLCASAAQALDITTLPPMDNTGWPEVAKLTGRDVEALDVALHQFRADRFSTSGDLKHFRVELRRRGDKLAASFFPEIDWPTQKSTPARNKYGTWITYFVSLRTLKIVGFTFERD